MSNDGPAEESEKPRLLKLTMTAAVTLVGGIVIIGGILVLLGSQRPGCGRTTEVTTAIAIESAVNNFYAEYSKIPDVGERVTTDSTNGLKLLSILLGLEDKSANPQNLRKLKFLAVKEGKNRKGGLIMDDTRNVTSGVFDRWGNPYTVILDSDGDEKLQFDFGGKPVHLEGRRAAIISPGADHKLGTSDDVTSWN